MKIKKQKDVNWEEHYKQICIDIGCSGMDNKCPGNPNCEIIKKVQSEIDLFIDKLVNGDGKKVPLGILSHCGRKS